MHVIINLNKPSGITSRQAVTKVKRLLGAGKAGHAGTLDPQATGVLLICLNEATKVTRFLMDMDKQYKARIKLGERTDTCDAEGRVIESRDVSFLSEAVLIDTVRTFKGSIQQKPPMYSAVKIGGKALYKLARKGIEIDRPDRTVHIYDIKITSIDIPYFDVTISCSKGTYIRSICDDIGLKLGTGAHMTSLERTAVGGFHIKDSFSFDDLASNEKQFYSIDQALVKLPVIELDEADYCKAKHGMQIILKSFSSYNGEFVKLKDPAGNLFAVGRARSNVISIERVLHLK
ncbi:MAG: tRNA pseudouridine(55) synthase TruB [Nitrospira bacterium HGW-Nitrospira-1]|nr:MAG: tRNA pseudouridine(55) synthase TruB [Nitrospira bacterium HGW-Nitrospira-1]